jgi:opacity protein-like surface antigen
MIKLYFIVVISILSTNLLAQDSKFKLLVKGGITDYGLVNLSIQKSGNASDDFWEIGPIIGAGLELSYGDNWYFQSTIEYSQNTYNGYVPYTYRGPVSSQETIEPGTNTVVDWMLNIKKRWSWFYIISGIGFSSQHSTDSYVSGYYGVYNYDYKIEGKSSNGMALFIGIGFEFPIFQNMDVFLENSWRIRNCTSPVIQSGISYEL